MELCSDYVAPPDPNSPYFDATDWQLLTMVMDGVRQYERKHRMRFNRFCMPWDKPMVVPRMPRPSAFWTTEVEAPSAEETYHTDREVIDYFIYQTALGAKVLYVAFLPER